MIARRVAAPLLPLRRSHTMPLLWAVALLTYIAGAGAVGVLAISRGEAEWRHAFAATMTVEVPADASPARLATVLALLKQTPGIAAVRPLTPAEEARLLKPWLGPGAQLDGLPVPRLIDLRIDAAGAVDVAALRDKLLSIVPDATLDDHATGLAGMRRAARRGKFVLATAIAVGLLAIVPAAIFAVSGAFAADRKLIELAHRLGATDRDIVGPFELRALGLGFAGGAAGALGGMLTVAELSRAAAVAAALKSASIGFVGPSDWRPWAIVAAIAAVAGLIAAAAARAGIARRVAEWP